MINIPINQNHKHTLMHFVKIRYVDCFVLNKIYNNIKLICLLDIDKDQDLINLFIKRGVNLKQTFKNIGETLLFRGIAI